jgi:hypothetical protein
MEMKIEFLDNGSYITYPINKKGGTISSVYIHTYHNQMGQRIEEYKIAVLSLVA